jgi:hypothetical protein
MSNLIVGPFAADVEKLALVCFFVLFYFLGMKIQDFI